MDLIQTTRELGKAIQQSEEYTRYQAAKAANDNDAELQRMIEEFNFIRVKLSTAMQKDEKDQDTDEMSKLDHDLKDVYTKVMGNENMMAFNIAKNELDAVMNRINGILMQCVNGEDPDTCEPPASCGGDCGSCGGCH